MPSAVGSLGLTDDSRLLVALRSGVHYFDPTTGALDLLVEAVAAMGSEVGAPGLAMRVGIVTGEVAVPTRAPVSPAWA